MIKLIGFDLDDTLLGSNKEIVDAEIISTLPSEGVRICLASGRPLAKNTIEYYKQLKESSDALYVGYNGATVYRLNGDIVYKNHLQSSDIHKIYNIVMPVINEHFKDSNLAFCLHTDKVLYANKFNWAVDMDVKFNDIGEELTDFEKNDLVGPKVMIDGDPEIISQLYPMIKDEIEKSYHSLISMPCYIEILLKDSNKYNGLLKVAEEYGIKPNEIMAFGDAGNDVEMIENAEIGVAMKDSRPEALKVSDFVTDTNDNHGVVKALKHYKIL